jgi:hypothetical protein
MDATWDILVSRTFPRIFRLSKSPELRRYAMARRFALLLRPPHVSSRPKFRGEKRYFGLARLSKVRLY